MFNYSWVKDINVYKKNVLKHLNIELNKDSIFSFLDLTKRLSEK